MMMADVRRGEGVVFWCMLNVEMLPEGSDAPCLRKPMFRNGDGRAVRAVVAGETEVIRGAGLMIFDSET